jgi:hypothetical protein
MARRNVCTSLATTTANPWTVDRPAGPPAGDIRDRHPVGLSGTDWGSRRAVSVRPVMLLADARSCGSERIRRRRSDMSAALVSRSRTSARSTPKGGHRRRRRGGPRGKTTAVLAPRRRVRARGSATPARTLFGFVGLGLKGEGRSCRLGAASFSMSASWRSAKSSIGSSTGLPHLLPVERRSRRSWLRARVGQTFYPAADVCQHSQGDGGIISVPSGVVAAFKVVQAEAVFKFAVVGFDPMRVDWGAVSVARKVSSRGHP